MKDTTQLFFLVILLGTASLLTLRHLSKLEKQVFDLRERIEILEKR